VSHQKDFFDRDLTRLAFLPIKNPELIAFYHEQASLFWKASEIKFEHDRDDWDRLDQSTKTYIEFILSFFAQLDGLVNENLVENFEKEVESYAKEASIFYAQQRAQEWVHNEAYSLFITAFIRDPKQQERMLNSIKYVPAVREIAEWALKWMARDKPLLERIVAFACLEGILFSSAFAGIYWIKRRNVLNALTKANEWIARDEAIHTRFAASLYKHFTDKWKVYPRLDEAKIHEIIKESVEVAEKFTNVAMNVELIGLNAKDMVTYIKCTADVLCGLFGYSKIYGFINPLDWMAVIGIGNKTNFFESAVTEYSRDAESEFVFDLSHPF
jgi:ribonucleotide reductase beta subunit family protein with ferritin-like domain